MNPVRDVGIAVRITYLFIFLFLKLRFLRGYGLLRVSIGITGKEDRVRSCLRVGIVPSRPEDVEGFREHVVVDETGVDREQACEYQGLIVIKPRRVRKSVISNFEQLAIFPMQYFQVHQLFVYLH